MPKDERKGKAAPTEVVVSIDPEDEDERKDEPPLPLPLPLPQPQPQQVARDEAWALAVVTRFRHKMRLRRLHVHRHAAAGDAEQARMVRHHHLVRDMVSGAQQGDGQHRKRQLQQLQQLQQQDPQDDGGLCAPMLHQLPLKPAPCRQVWEPAPGATHRGGGGGGGGGSGGGESSDAVGAAEMHLAMSLHYSSSSAARRATGSRELGCGWPQGDAAEARLWRRLARACVLGAALLLVAAAREWGAACCDASDAAGGGTAACAAAQTCSAARAAGEALAWWAGALCSVSLLLSWLASPSRTTPCCCTLRALSQSIRHAAAAASEAALSATLAQPPGGEMTTEDEHVLQEQGRGATSFVCEAPRGALRRGSSNKRLSVSDSSDSMVMWRLQSALEDGSEVQLHVLLLPLPEEQGCCCRGGGTCVACCAASLSCCLPRTRAQPRQCFPCACCKSTHAAVQLLEAGLPSSTPAAVSGSCAAGHTMPLSRCWVQPSEEAEQAEQTGEGGDGPADEALLPPGTAAVPCLPCLLSATGEPLEERGAAVSGAQQLPVAPGDAMRPYFVLCGGGSGRISSCGWPPLRARRRLAAAAPGLLSPPPPAARRRPATWRCWPPPSSARRSCGRPST